jgi:hypothetical protein
MRPPTDPHFIPPPVGTLWNQPKPVDPNEIENAAFDKANPGIYSAVRRMALDYIAQGHKHWSVDAIMQILRHETGMKDGSGSFKINNHHRGYLARRFLAEFPQHEGFFETRERRTA